MQGCVRGGMMVRRRECDYHGLVPCVCSELGRESSSKWMLVWESIFTRTHTTWAGTGAPWFTTGKGVVGRQKMGSRSRIRNWFIEAIARSRCTPPSTSRLLPHRGPSEPTRQLRPPILTLGKERAGRIGDLLATKALDGLLVLSLSDLSVPSLPRHLRVTSPRRAISNDHLSLRPITSPPRPSL